jgi:hypothetical protein
MKLDEMKRLRQLEDEKSQAREVVANSSVEQPMRKRTTIAPWEWTSSDRITGTCV